MKFMENKNAIVISMFFLFLLVDCSSNNVKKDNVVECRLFWVSDTYPEEVENAEGDDIRFIRLHYLIINNMSEDCFLPIRRTIAFGDDSLYCSTICAYIDNKPINTWFSVDTRWNGLLKSNDSVHAELKISEWVLDSAKVDKRIQLAELLKMLDVRYTQCISDTIFSSHIPQLYFTKNDTIAIYYKKSTTQFHNPILCQ